MVGEHAEKFFADADDVKKVECVQQDAVGSPCTKADVGNKVVDEVKPSKVADEVKPFKIEDEVKPSFIDILKSKPDVSFEKEKRNVVRRKNNNYAGVIIPQFGSYKPTQQPTVTPALVVDDTVTIRQVAAAEKRLQAATLAKVGIQQQVGIKEAVWRKSKEAYEAALSEQKVLKNLLKAKNIKISEAQFVLKGLKKFGCAVDVLGQDCTALKSVALADGIKWIHDGLLSSGIGVHDLDWNELADELLKPMKKEIVLLKEEIQKAGALTKASKKNYDCKTGELNILKAQLGEADTLLQEADRDLKRLQNKDIPQEEEVLKKACEGDKKLAKDESKPSCLEEVDSDYNDNESCKENVGSNSVKAIEDTYNCVEETVESPYRCNSDQTPEPEDGCSSQSEQGIEREVGCKSEEFDCSGDIELLAEDTNEEKEEKVVELSEIEQAKETTHNDNHHNLPAEPQIEKRKKSRNNKKKAKRKARKAQGKGELRAQEGCEALTRPECRFASCMKLRQACLASLGLSLMGYCLLYGCPFGSH